MDKKPENMTVEEKYKYRIENRTCEELNRAKKYNCDGLCYDNKFMCPRAEYCEETCLKEGLAEILIIISLIAIFILPFIFIFFF